MRRFLAFLRLILILTAVMFGGWVISAALLPEGVLRPYFSRLFAGRVGTFTFGQVFIANLLPFFGLQFMNLFRIGKHAGGVYVLPVFWLIVGILYGTNSFVFAGEPVPFSVAALWTRTGFTELLAYTLSYEASREWTLWEQRGLWRVRRLSDRAFAPRASDWLYWIAGLALLIIAVAREVQ